MSYDLIYRNPTNPSGDTVTGTTSETAISSQAPIKTGMMVLGRPIVVNIDGSYSTIPVSVATLILKLKLNGTTISTANFTSLALSQSSGNLAIRCKFRPFQLGVSGKIDVKGSATLSTSNLTPTQASMSSPSPVTIDTTVDQTLTLTVQLGGLGGSSATVSITQFDVGTTQ